MSDLLREEWGVFVPCVIENKGAGFTEMLLRDCMTVWEPVGPGHAIDLGYDTNGDLVGIRIWGCVARKRPPEATP